MGFWSNLNEPEHQPTPRLSPACFHCATPTERQGKFPKVYITVIQDLKSMGALARDLPPGSLVDVKERKAVVPVPALGPSVSRQS